MKDKRSIIRILNDDNYCLVYALLIAKAHPHVDDHPFYNSIRKQKYTKKNNSNHLADAINSMIKDCLVGFNGCSIQDVMLIESKLHQYLITPDRSNLSNRYEIMVINERKETIYHKRNQNANKFIYLLYHNNHFDVITSPAGFFNRCYFCDYCKNGYNTFSKHNCMFTCNVCNQQDCQKDVEIKCSKCQKTAKNSLCLAIHKERQCVEKVQCEKCLHYKTDNVHVCIGEKYCRNCKVSVEVDHKCFIQKPTEKKTKKFDGYIFFDFETYKLDDNSDHIVNLAMAQKICVKCLDLEDEKRCNACQFKHKFNNITDYCYWAFQQENTIQIAHNMKKYDGVFILNFIVNNLLPTDLDPTVISNGAKIMSIRFRSIKIIDSLSFLPMSLEKFSKTFDLNELKKGYFPHDFNKPENFGKIFDSFPDITFYNSDFFSNGKKIEFEKWYESNQNKSFDFDKEFEDYCWSDVRLLTEGCLKFRKITMEDTQLDENDNGVDPFQNSITIASHCNLVYCRNHMPENSIGLISSNGFNPFINTSKKALLWLRYIAESRNIFVKHQRNSGEMKCGPYYLDGVDEANKTIYEFHGCYWHGCPSCYNKTTFNKVYQIPQYAIYIRHTERINYIKSKLKEYSLVEIWEHDWDIMTKSNLDLKNFLENQSIVDEINPRDALYGGRTQCYKLYHLCNLDENEEIRYIDYTSLYPFIQKYGIFPIGHPEIITENFDYDNSNYFGLIKLDIIPPVNLYIPVLPTRIDGKLFFTLCRTCAELKLVHCEHNDNQRSITGTYCTLEVDMALRYGYKILKIHEIWNYKEREQYNKITKTGGLFTSYQNDAMKKKIESSGWPSNTTTEEQKNEYIKSFFDIEGIVLDKNKIEKNSGRRQISKLVANNQWGYLGMNTNKMQYKILREYKNWLLLLNDETIKIHDVSFINEKTMFVYYSELKAFHEGGLRTNVVLASFVTAQARLKLFDEMNRLNKRVLYCDTDSIFYTTKPGEYNPKTGTNLGEFTNEIDPEEGLFIKEWICNGKKNYAYKTDKNKTHCTVKGFTFNHLTNLVLNFDSMKNINLGNHNDKIECQQYVFKRDKKKLTITTGVQKKMYSFVYDTRILLDDFKTLPFGYKSF